ncbi:hypothetical protein GW17_00043756 [Ensete ventricosum]|nr:hypothetical protein GW17_00043756 [Ensete ventricosum]
MIRTAGELDCFSAYICLREPDKSEDKTKYANIATKEAKENIIGASPATGSQRPCMGVTVCLSIDQGELLGKHRGVEADGRKGRRRVRAIRGRRHAGEPRARATAVHGQGQALAGGPRTGNLADRYVPPGTDGKCRNCKPWFYRLGNAMVDARVLDQGMKYAVRGTVPFLLKGVATEIMKKMVQFQRQPKLSETCSKLG